MMSPSLRGSDPYPCGSLTYRTVCSFAETLSSYYANSAPCQGGRKKLPTILQAPQIPLHSILQMGIPLVIEDGLWYNKMFQICARNGAFQREEASMGIHDGHREKMRRRFLETGLGGLCGPRGPGAAAVLRHPPGGTPTPSPTPDGAVRLPLRRAERPGGGSGEGGRQSGRARPILLSLVSRLSRKARIADASQETILNSSERAGAYLLERLPASGGSWSSCCVWTARAGSWPASGWRRGTWPART